MSRRWTPIFVLLVGGCAYFNGIYNSKTAARSADRQYARGEAYAAADSYRASAARADSVLARHPKTRYRGEALYLSARGHAFANECGVALQRLDEYLAIPNEPAERRERALIAQASCLLYNRQLIAADTILTPLLSSADRQVRAEAALWGGRVALALGDVPRAGQLLATVPGGAATWEFITAAFEQRDYAKAESLLVLRAMTGDWRSEVPGRVRELWGAGHRDGAIRVVDFYGRSRAPQTSRVTLHFIASDLAAATGDTALARRQAEDAGNVGVTAAVEAEVRARLLALRIRELDALSDVYAAVSRDSARAAGSPLLRRIQDNLMLMRLSVSRVTGTGAEVFVAAEVVRDSLNATRLAHAMFKSIERDYPDYEIAARALLAAAPLMPDSNDAYRARIAERWPRSFAAARLGWLDVDSSTVLNEDIALRNAWRFATAQLADSLKERRRVDSLNAASGRGGPPR